jgi:hypothetical protein
MIHVYYIRNVKHSQVLFFKLSQSSGGSRIFVSGGASMGMGAIESKKRVMGSFLDLFCCGKTKISFANGGDRPQCPPPKSATDPTRIHLDLPLINKKVFFEKYLFFLS